MNDIVAVLTQHQAPALAWRLVVWAFAAYLLALGAMTFIRPALAGRFIQGHASSARANLLEAALRLLVGVGLMGASPAMKFSAAFFWFGAVLAVTAIPMMFLFGLHQRYAVWAIPFAMRILPIYGLLALALGGVIVWAIA